MNTERVFPLKVYVKDKSKSPSKRQFLNARIPYNYTVEEVIDYFNNIYGIGTSFNLYEQKSNKLIKPYEHISKYIPPFVLSYVSEDEDINKKEEEENEESEESESDDSYPTLDKIIALAEKKEKKEQSLLKKKKKRNPEEDEPKAISHFQPDDEKEFMKMFTETVKYAKCYIVKGNYNRNLNPANNKLITKFINDTGKTSVTIEELCEKDVKPKNNEEITLAVKKDNIQLEEENDDDDLEIVEDINAFVQSTNDETYQSNEESYSSIVEFKEPLPPKENQTDTLIIPQSISPKEIIPTKIKKEKRKTVIPKEKVDYFSQIKEFFNKNYLTREEKNKVKSIFTSIQNAPMEQSNYRMNIVLDLDNTLLFSQLVFNNVEINEEDVYTYCMIDRRSSEFNGKFVYRPGLKEFFEATKGFADYYVYSLGIENYVKCLVEELEKKFKIHIKKMIWRNDALGNYKCLEYLGIDVKKTIIIDDQNGPWRMPYGTNSNFNHSHRILNSYRYLNAFYLNHNISRFTLQDFGPLCYTNLTNSLFTLESQTCVCRPLPTDNMNIPFYIEHEFSPKHQFDYFGNVFKKIYKCAVIGRFQPLLSLALTRYCTLINCVFCLGFCLNNYKEIRDMIISCGGEISTNMSEPNITHFVVDKSGYGVFKSEDRKKNNAILNTKFVVNPKFVFDSFYLVTKVNEKDPEYAFDKII